MVIKKYKISDLKPSEYNPRKLNIKQREDMEASLDEFGLVEPLVINEYKGREGIIVGGHQRYYILKEKGVDEVDVSVVNLPLEKEQKLNLRLNRNQGSWDWDLLVNFEKELLLEAGFEALEIDTAFSLNDLQGVDLDQLKADLQKEINEQDQTVIYKFTIPLKFKEQVDNKLLGLDKDVNTAFLKLVM